MPPTTRKGNSVSDRISFRNRQRQLSAFPFEHTPRIILIQRGTVAFFAAVQSPIDHETKGPVHPLEKQEIWIPRRQTHVYSTAACISMQRQEKWERPVENEVASSLSTPWIFLFEWKPRAEAPKGVFSSSGEGTMPREARGKSVWPGGNTDVRISLLCLRANFLCLSHDIGSLSSAFLPSGLQSREIDGKIGGACVWKHWGCFIREISFSCRAPKLLDIFLWGW